MPTLTHAEVLAQLKRLVAASTMRGAAKELKLSPQFLSNVLSGERDIGPTLARALRLRKVVKYEELPIRQGTSHQRRQLIEFARSPSLEELIRRAERPPMAPK